MFDNQTPRPLSVFQYIELVNTTMKQLRVSVVGEISELTLASSGHAYFTLKDPKENAVMKCVIWRHNYQTQGVKLAVGLEVILSGKMEMYAPYGRIQYIASSIELVGEGQLKMAYDALKRQLTSEGIFSDENKRTLPLFPKHIGIITSLQGAVIHDFSNNVGKHNFTFHLCDSRIEGKQSLEDLLLAVKSMRNQPVDLLIIMRGGGSLQSLGAFDTEALVRAVKDFPVPVIAAIGHHQDVTLSALAADAHVSTPTAAAMLLNKSWDDATLTVNKYTSDILTRYQQTVQNSSQLLEQSKLTITEQLMQIIEVFMNAEKKVESLVLKCLLSISHYRLRLQQQSDQITNTFSRNLAETLQTTCDTPLVTAFKNTFDKAMQDLSHCEDIITLRDPRRMLQYGYSIIRSGDSLVKSIEDVRPGDNLNLLLADGEIQSIVEGVKKHE